MHPEASYQLSNNFETLISAAFKIASMLITALALSTAAIALPLLRINRKLSDLIASIGGSVITEILRERIRTAQSKLDSERKPHA